MSYDGVNVNDLDVLKPTEGATPPSELNGSDREIKTVLKNQFAIATKTAAYTLLGSDHIILANGTFAITLPTASTVAGSGYKKEFIVINIGTGTITITGTVDGVSNPTLTTQYSSMTIETDGTNYYSVGINALLKTGGNMTGTLNEAEGAAIASAATCEIWSTDGNTAHITGTTGISSFGTALQAGCWKKLIFDGVLTITNGANLIVQGNADYTTAAGDTGFVYADTTTQHRLYIFRADGTAVVGGADGKAKVSANDTTAGYLNGKLTADTNTGLALVENNNGGDETFSITKSAYAAGNYAIATSSAYGTKTGTSYQKAKEIMVARSGTLRMSWRMCAVDDIGTAFGRIYRNGVAVGSEKTTENQSLTDMTDDIAGWSAGDLCQLYAKNDYEGASVGYDNFNLNNSFYIGEKVIL